MLIYILSCKFMFAYFLLYRKYQEKVNIVKSTHGEAPIKAEYEFIYASLVITFILKLPIGIDFVAQLILLRNCKLFVLFMFQ